jgi:hypothetical protein
MPFYIFKVNADKTTEYLDEAEKYRDARDKVRTLRIQHTATDGITYRMVHAKSIGQAEILLAPNHKEERIIGDD